MAKLNRAKRLFSVKIVYYGPGLSGKTTNLERLHEIYAEQQRGELVKLATETERTLFFDYMPAHLGKLSGFDLKADLFTVPGQSFYHSTRKVVLEGADGVVFVADSHPRREEANIDAMQSLRENLKSYGRSIDDVPVVVQYNKRDLPSAMPLATMQRVLNPDGLPHLEASSLTGEGVLDTQERILQLVLDHLREQSRRQRA